MKTAMRTATVASVLATLLGACSARAETRPSVLLVCIDTLRADHLGCYGYDRRSTSPALDALAAESILFADASATAGWTKPSVPSFFTGTYPAQHGVYEGSSEDSGGRTSHVLPDDALTVAEVFAERGYRTGAFVKNAQLRRGQGLEQGFETYVDRAGDAREIRWRALDWLDATDDGRPFFLYLHLLDVHWPYPVPDEYATRFTDAESIERFRGDDWKALRDAVNDGEVSFDGEDREALLALYDGAIRFADDQLSMLFAGLRRRSEWDDTVVCVLSDHGEEFGENGRIGHGHGLSEGLLRVPWILRIPGRKATRVRAQVSLVDLFPTLLASAGITTPASPSVQGRDRLLLPGAGSPVFAEHKAPDRYLVAVRHGGAKTIRQAEPRSARELSLSELFGTIRIEVELDRDEAGRLVACEVEASDDSMDDPVELKGVLDSYSGSLIRVGGVVLAVAADLELRPPNGGPERPEPGGLVKARLAPDGSGGFHCTRLKLYPPDAEPDFEIRGVTSAVDEGGVLELAGIPIRIDTATAFDGLDTERKRLSRTEVVELLEGGLGEGGVAGIGWTQRDLVLVEGAERAAASAHPPTLGEHLRQWALRCAATRTFGEGDRSRLDESELLDLRAIGYAD